MRILLVFLAVVFAARSPALAGAAASSATGVWRAFDDGTGEEQARVRIEETNGVLHGFILSTNDPSDADRTCDACQDDRKGQKTIGLEIIRGMRRDGENWSGGRVLDPRNGALYRGTIHVEDGGRKLVLRGYIGISLFGRSQTWLRAGP